ncbi:MAG: MotA/TolQ/ExbB proton channel family protein [Flavobacteriia bacterium]|nr:MotA/TolQ/ExbB proton channel family protein [Flavobacteriia bacterium]
MKCSCIKVGSTIGLIAFSFFTSAQDSLGGNANAGAEGEKLQKVAEVSAFDFLLKGGVFLIPIVLLLFYTLYVIIERYLYIRRMTKYDAKLIDSIRPHMAKAAFQDALSSVQSNDTAYGSVIKEGIRSSTTDANQAQVESNMEKVANIEIGKMEKNLGHLGLIAGIAPTLGFIGTISGVIKIFYSISITENVSIGNISGGLYEKMISSGAGLVVGIIAFAGYHLLNALIDAYALRIQQVNLEFMKSTQ